MNGTRMFGGILVCVAAVLISALTIHVKGSDGAVRISKADWKMWQNLITGDTLR